MIVLCCENGGREVEAAEAEVALEASRENQGNAEI